MSINNRIRELRLARGMKQDELARRCGVKQGASKLSSYLKNTQK